MSLPKAILPKVTLVILTILSTVSAARPPSGMLKHFRPTITATATSSGENTLETLAPTHPPCRPNTPGCEAICDNAFCDENGTSWCFYWEGVVTWDVSQGVSPAETRVPLGPCHGN
ncbi:hypothetical protein E4U21_004239 [Claviceps maximensis]|nr:hypothetical protein E4U21_004239 [Claviceps maximensis]